MENTEKEMVEGRTPITSEMEVDQAIREIERREQFYSLALFDILGFSNFVENNETDAVGELYQKLLNIIHRAK